MKTPRTASEALALARIADRAANITNDYRLIYDRHEGCFKVAHKDDRTRRYTVTVRTCSCPSFAKHGQCKHFIGLADLCQVEIDRYSLLNWEQDLQRMAAFWSDLRDEQLLSDPVFLAEIEERFAIW